MRCHKFALLSGNSSISPLHPFPFLFPCEVCSKVPKQRISIDYCLASLWRINEYTYILYISIYFIRTRTYSSRSSCVPQVSWPGPNRFGKHVFTFAPQRKWEPQNKKGKKRLYNKLRLQLAWGRGGVHHYDHRKGQTSAAAPTHRCSISGGRVSSNALRLSIAVCKLQNNRAPQTSSMFRHVRTWLMSAAPKKKEAAHTSLAKQTTSRIRSVVSAQYVGSSINSKLFFRSLVSCASHFID